MYVVSPLVPLILASVTSAAICRWSIVERDCRVFAVVVVFSRHRATIVILPDVFYSIPVATLLTTPELSVLISIKPAALNGNMMIYNKTWK